MVSLFIDGWYVLDSYYPLLIERRAKLWPKTQYAFQAEHFVETKPELTEEISLTKNPREVGIVK